MAKDATVAPKERINVVFKPADGPAGEEVELPLKLMMLGDYSSQEDDTPVEERKVVSIDKNNFNDVLASKDLKLSMVVDNKLSADAEDELTIELKIKQLSDFEPESVAKQVPELQKLLELRESLTTLKGPLGNVPSFRKHLQNIVNNEDSRNKLLKELEINKKAENDKSEEPKTDDA